MLVPSDIPELLKPGRTTPLPGRILVPPHGRLIWQGKKKAILSSRLDEKYIGIPVYFIEGNKALGIMELKAPEKIDLKDFKRLRKIHRVTDEEYEKWWKGKKFLYFYPLEVISKFDPPKEIERPKGAQVWLKAVTFKSLEFLDPKKLTDEELLQAHERLNKFWKERLASEEELINYNLLILNEIKERKLEIPETELDKESKRFQEQFSKSGFKVYFFGTKGLVEEEGPGHRFHTAILYEYKGKRLLVDYGKINQGNLDKIKPDYILTSHSHPDHLLGLRDMSVIVSEDTEKEIPNLYKDFNIDTRARYKSYETFQLGPFKITPIPVLHSIRAKMHVFLIEMGDKRVLQATDILGWHSGDREKYIKNLDLAIIDGSSFSKTLARRKGKEGEPYGHASIVTQLKNWYKPENVKRIIITHLGKEPLEMGDEELLRKAKEITNVPIAVATDETIINLSEDFAPIYTSGKVLGRRVSLEEILPYFKDFLIQRPICYLTGGIVNQGSTTGDIDLLLPDWLSFDMRRIIEFRIARSVPWWIRRRLHFVYDRFATPFTNALPLYNLAMLRSEDEILRLSEVSKQLREKPRIESAIKDAEASAREDKIKLFRYFLPLKPTRGYYPERRQTIDLFIEVMEEMGDYPFYSTKKYDGFHVEVHKKGDRVKIFSEDGEVVTSRLPNVIKEIQALSKEDLVLMAELEIWRDGKHYPREVAAGYMHQKGTPDDSDVVLNVYDLPYFKEDIHNKPFEKRLKLLESLPFKQRTWKIPNTKIKLNFAPYLLSKNREELRRHTEFLRRLPGSEGNVCKTRDFIYNLKGIRSGMVKFHNSTVVYGKVLRVKETKVKGVFNYYFGLEKGDINAKVEELENRFYHRVGRTFSTSLKAKVGDVLEIEGETLNVEHNLKDNSYKLSLWAPRVMKKVDRKPDTIKEAIERAKKNFCLQEKEITEEGKIIYLSEIEKLHLEQFRAEGIDEDLAHPKERYKELIADLRYLGNSAFPRLKSGKRWGEWMLEDVLKYFAKIVDTLRGIYFPILPPKKGSKEYSSSYWRCYRESEKYMRSKPPKESEIKDWEKKRKEWMKKIEKGFFPYFGGLKRFKNIILQYFPEHKRYIEIFGGKGEMIWEKEPSEEEIYNDKDEVLVKLFRILKRLSSSDLVRLSKFNWIGGREYFESLKRKKPKNDLEFFHKWIYIHKFGKHHAQPDKDDFNELMTGKNIWANLKREIEKSQERIKNVKIFNKDWSDVLEEFDSKDTFIFADPPYPGREIYYRIADIDWEKLWKKFSDAKSKILMIYMKNIDEGIDERIKPFFKNWHVKRFRVRKLISHWHPNIPKYFYFYLIANYPLQKSKIEKQSDPYLEYPRPEKPREYVIQRHFRGKSVSDRTPIIIRENGKVKIVPIQNLFTYQERNMTLCEKKLNGIEIWTKNGWSKLKGVTRHRQDSPIVRLVTMEGFLETTKDHSVFTPDGKAIAVSELKEGDRIELIDLPKLQGNQDVDKEIAWLYGFYLAEGSKRKNRGIVISNSKRELLEKCRKIANKLGLKSHIYPDKNNWKIEINWNIGPIFEVSGCHEVKERLARWKVVPSCVFSWNKESQKAFLEGYFAGDGINISEKHIEWASSSQSVAQGILVLAKNLYNFPYFRILLQNDDKSDVYRIVLAKEHNLLQKERNVLKKIIKAKSLDGVGEKNNNFRTGKYVSKNQEEFFIYSKRRWVYDVETENHDFLAGIGRIRAHNSHHLDLRIKHNDYLIGWTIADAVKGKPGKPITTLEQAKALDQNEISKIDWKKGVPKLRPGIKPGFKEKYAELAAMRKSPEPVPWLNVEGVVPKGSVGATKQFPGVFHIIDKGYCEFGALKPYFCEYFFSKGKLKGRWFFRQLRPSEFRGTTKKANEIIPPSRETEFRQEAAWFFIKPIDETPYVISDAAVEKKWIPPYGISALPEKIRKKIPKEFQYWKEKDEKKRIEIRDKLVKELAEKLIEKRLTPGMRWAKAAYRYVLSKQVMTFWRRTPLPGKIKRVQEALNDFLKLHPLKKEWIGDAIKWLESRPNEMKELIAQELRLKKSREIRWVLQHHWWRGQKVIRAGASREHWDLRLDFPSREGLMHFVLMQNPLKNKEVTAILKPCKYKEWMNFSGYIPPENERKKMSKEELAKFPPGIEEANPTKETSCFMEILDKGKAIVYEDGDLFKKFEFKGNKLKGLWVFIRENTSSFWIMKKSSLPKTEKILRIHENCKYFENGYCKLKEKQVDPKAPACPKFESKE